MQHFMRHCIGEENHQVWAPEFISQSAAGLGENLCLTLIVFAQLLVTAFHAFISTDNYNTHNILLPAQ